jgi:WD40 repeat protein/tRNA A-37 threonylcarbamoyl transferase component Bud32
MALGDAERDDLLDRLVEEFAGRLRRGEQPSLKDYTNRYPELADEIRALFPAMVQVEQVGEICHDWDEAETRAPPLSQVGDYRIIREIGHGGMGVVYEAEQISLGRRVALKLLPWQAARDRTTMERFRREARASARLHHTNIVPVFEVGQDDQVCYYAMQYIQGQSLDAVIDELQRLRGRSPAVRGRRPAVDLEKTRRAESGTRGAAAGPGVAQSLLTGRFEREPAVGPAAGVSPDRPEGSVAVKPVSADAPDVSAVMPGGAQLSTVESRHRTFHRGVAQIGRQAASALAHAHARGIVHRDVKPSNLLLDTEGVVWVSDFGLAKVDDDPLTRTGDILGTLRYMAPERFRGRGDARADLYSLGLTIYELLVLRPAFDSPDRLALSEQIKLVEPPRPRSIDPRIPRDLETIVLKAIEKDPKARYASAEAMAEDLRRFLDDEPILARRVGAAEQYLRWARRNPGMAVLGGVLTVVLVVATAASLLAAGYFNRLRLNEAHARHEAEQASNEARRRGEAERWGRYRSNVATAAGALELQNSGVARSALDDAPQEHRNWEWRYLHNQLDSASLALSVPGGPIKALRLSPSGRQLAVCCFGHNEAYLYDVATGRLDAVLRGHSAAATSVAYRPDGKRVATIGNDQTLRLWAPGTGRELALFRAEVAPPNLDREPHVAYSPDGSRIASSADRDPGSAGTSRLWDGNTGEQIAVLAKWQEDFRPVAFSPDGKRVAVGSGEQVFLCDAVTGRRLAGLGPHAKAVGKMVFSPDGKRIAYATNANDIHLCNGESGKEVAVLRGHTASISSLLFSPDGSRLVSGSDYPDNTARLWDAATGRMLFVLAGHKNVTMSVAFSPDGKRVATSSSDQTARLWDVRTGQLLTVLSGHRSWVWHVLFSPDGTRLVTASDDATLRLWDALTGEWIGVLRGHGHGIRCAPVFTPDGSRLVSGSLDGTVRIWDTSLVERNGILRGHVSYVYDVAFSPNGEQVASAAWDGTARLWDATTGRQTGLLKHETLIVNSVAYSGDGRLLASAERERGVKLWDLASRQAARDSWLIVPHFWDNRAAMNPAGTLLAAGCAQGPVRVWEVATGREVARLEGHDKETKDAAFRPDGSLLATTGTDGAIRLWNVATGAPVAVLRGHTGTVWRVAFSAGGKLLASGSDDKTIRLWDTQTHRQLAVIALESVVFGVAFSPDGTRLAAGCRDNTIRLFDVASRKQVAELRGHNDYVHAVAWSPDGTCLVSGSGDFTVRIWDSLSVQERARRAAETQRH